MDNMDGIELKLDPLEVKAFMETLEKCNKLLYETPVPDMAFTIGKRTKYLVRLSKVATDNDAYVSVLIRDKK